MVYIHYAHCEKVCEENFADVTLNNKNNSSLSGYITYQICLCNMMESVMMGALISLFFILSIFIVRS